MPHAYNHTYKEASTQTVESDFPVVEDVLPLRKCWDSALTKFLTSAGLRHALRGFELDMLVMNEDWEKGKVPPALQDLVKDISVNIISCYLRKSLRPYIGTGSPKLRANGT